LKFGLVVAGGVLVFVYYVWIFWEGLWIKKMAVQDTYTILVQWLPILLDVLQMMLQSTYFKMSAAMSDEYPAVTRSGKTKPPVSKFSSSTLIAVSLFLPFFVLLMGGSFQGKKTYACYFCSELTRKILHTISDLNTPAEVGSKPTVLMGVVAAINCSVFAGIFWFFPKSDASTSDESTSDESTLSGGGSDVVGGSATIPSMWDLNPGSRVLIPYLMIIGFFLVAIFCYRHIGLYACNANENWNFKEVARTGHSDWLVKYGWFIEQDTCIELSDQSGTPKYAQCVMTADHTKSEMHWNLDSCTKPGKP